MRANFPAFAYQLGNLFAAYIIVLEAQLAQSLGTAKVPDYSLALAIFAGGACLAVAILAAVGREAKGVDFMKVADEELRKEVAVGD